ncbi:MAG: ABC transporter substrate-binding protein, partial [Candidatus Tectomicrobia bacterium]
MRRDKTACTLLLGCLIVVWALVLAPAGFSGAATPRQGGTLVYGLETEPGVLDPHIFGPWATARVVMHIFDALVTFDTTTGSPRPPIVGQLAKSWDLSADGKVYTFHLQRGVTFHDGTPFNAAAVKANIERMTDKDSPYFFERAYARQRVAWRWLQQVDILDDYTIRLTLSQPFSDFLAYLADKQQPSAMISPTAIKKYGNKGIAQHLIGTGPFTVVEQVPGEKVVLKRFEGYWGKKPYLDRVIIRPIPDPASRVLALQTGEADIITIPPPDSKAQLIKQGFTWMQGDV